MGAAITSCYLEPFFWEYAPADGSLEVANIWPVRRTGAHRLFHAGEQDIMTKRDVSRMESADDYPGVVADFGKWRQSP
jgi:hypothetical protein